MQLFPWGMELPCREPDRRCAVWQGGGGALVISGLALTWVDDLHSGVGFRMLFMDDLCADLLGEDLKSEQR